MSECEVDPCRGGHVVLYPTTANQVEAVGKMMAVQRPCHHELPLNDHASKGKTEQAGGLLFNIQFKTEQASRVPSS